METQLLTARTRAACVRSSLAPSISFTGLVLMVGVRVWVRVSIRVMFRGKVRVKLVSIAVFDGVLCISPVFLVSQAPDPVLPQS